MAASCSLATFTLASASSAWACSASAWALAAFAGDSRLGCLLTTVSWLRSLNERTCLAWTMRQLLSEPPPASAFTLVTAQYAVLPGGLFKSKSTIFACPQEG
jgi:hypothetical protein